MSPAKPLWREIASSLTLWSLGALAFTGLALYVVLWSGGDDTGDELLGLALDQWADLHDVLGLTFLGAAAVTLALGRPVWPSASAAHGAAALTLVVLVNLTLLQLPPVSWVLPEGDIDEEIESFEEEAEQLPYPGAGLEPLAAVAREMEMDATRVAIALQEAGLRYESLDETLEAIAARNGTTAGAVYEAIRHLEAAVLAPHEEAAREIVEARFMGHDVRGKTVGQLAAAASVPIEVALRRLRAAGMEAKADDMADAVAARSGAAPMDVLAALVIEGYQPKR